MNLQLPELSLVLLIGASSAGKSTLARRLFGPHEVLSSDACRAMVANSENVLDANDDAFHILYQVAGIRLRRGLLTVIDATNVQAESRRKLVDLAKQYHVLPAALVLDLPMKDLVVRNAARPDRQVPPHALENQQRNLRKGLKGLKKEGFRHIHIFSSQEEIDAIASLERTKLFSDKKHLTGPFDIIGDVHGCHEELMALLEKLGYSLATVPEENGNHGWRISHPEGRTVVFVGDLVDRGPGSPQVLKLAMSMQRSGVGLCVPGNHDMKLQKWLAGTKVKVNHGLEETVEQLKAEPESFKEELREWLYNLVSHAVLDGGRLVVAHAGLREEMHGRTSGRVREFCLYGETTGETDEFGLPVRYPWAKEYKGSAMVVYGHTPVPEAEWINNTIDIDTGCVFGGKLTALRYPEKQLVEVPAKQVYREPARPFLAEAVERVGDIIDIDEVLGKQVIETALVPRITLPEGQTAAALETMSRFAIDPRWLIYLPPTMAPVESSKQPGLLEHPAEAFKHYQHMGINQVICQQSIWAAEP